MSFWLDRHVAYAHDVDRGLSLRRFATIRTLPALDKRDKTKLRPTSRHSTPFVIGGLGCADWCSGRLLVAGS